MLQLIPFRISLAAVITISSMTYADDSTATMFLKKNCIACHGPKKQEGDLRLDLAISESKHDQRDLWKQIRGKIVEREMPPEDAPQPSSDERTRLFEWIEATYGSLEDDSENHWSFLPIVRPEVPSGDPEANPIDAFVESRLRDNGLHFSSITNRRTLIRRISLDLTGLPPTPEDVRTFLDDPSDDESAFARVVDRLLSSPQYGERWAQHWLDVIRWAETVGFETNLERPDAWHYRDWVIRSLNEDKPYDRFIVEQIAGDTVGEDAALGFLVAGPANLAGQIGRDEEAMRQARQDELDEVIKTVSQAFFGLTIGCARCHDHKFDPISQRDYYSMQANFAGLSYGYRRLRGELNDQWTERVPAAKAELDDLYLQLEMRRRRHGLRPPLQPVQTEEFTPVEADAVRMEIFATESGTASLYEFEIWSSGEESTRHNVALAQHGAVPSASSFALANQTRHFDNLVDGSVDKRQAFPWDAAEGGTAWIQIEIPETKVDRITWHSGSSMPASYEIAARDPGSGTWRTVAHTRDRLPRVSDARRPETVELTGLSGDDVDSLFDLLTRIRNKQSELSRLSNGPQVYAASFSDEPDDTWLLRRGDPMQRAVEVLPDVPGILIRAVAETCPESEVDRRLTLARHLASPDHPLAARVMVNRIWQHHFGTGLVETSSDFGKMGAKPSHPLLLDWLASEFVAREWSLKDLHQLIVNSRTYRQTSRPDSHALTVDADSRLLWRFPPRRLDAEAIRDSILMVSGKLNSQMYGRGFDFFDRRGGLSDYTAVETFGVSGWRRMIYAHKIRMEAVDIFGAFDCPDAGQMTPRRNQSITPIQALGLLNSPFTNRQATFFADRVRTESLSSDPADWVDQAFEIAISRPPSEAERERLTELAKIHGLEQVCRVLINSSGFVFLY